MTKPINDSVTSDDFICKMLGRVADDRGEATALEMAIANIRGNLAYLLLAIGEVQAIELLGEMREVLLAKALDRAHGVAN